MRWNNPRLDPKPAANGYYYIKWNEYCERRQRFISQKLSTRTKARAEAEAAFKGWLTAGGPEGSLPPAGDALGVNVTVADVFDDYIARCIAPEEQKQTRAVLSSARAALGDVPALDAQKALDAWLAARKATHKDGTNRRVGAAILAAYRWAAGTRRWRPRNRNPILPASAVPEIELAPHSPARVDYLRLDQEAIHKAEAKAHPRVYIFTMLGLHAGPRREAIEELTWDRVDFDANQGKGSIDYRVPGQRTTNKRRSKVPMSPEIRKVLLEWRVRQGQGGIGPVVGNAAGQAYDTWRKKSSHPWASAHILRHTYASLALQSGVTLWEVAKVLADDYKTVEKTYGHAGDLTHAVR